MTFLGCRFPRGLLLTVILAAPTVVGCAAGDDNTGVGGVLVVAQVEVAAGDGGVLVGGTRQLQATPRTSTGLPVPGKTIAWASGNSSLATVSSTGLVTGVSVGVTEITATVDGVIGRTDVHVRPVPVASVVVTAAVTSLEAGSTTQLQAAALDSVGGVLGGRLVAWSSSAGSVATVSTTGLVTALSPGSATITATIEGRTGSVTLTITAPPATQLGFLIQPPAGTAGVPLSPAIQVAYQDANGATAVAATGTITLALSGGPAGASLGGTVSAPAVQGVATFTNLQIARAGQGYVLQANASNVTPATSSAFGITAGPPAELGVVTAPAGTAASGAALVQQPVIQLRDAFGNEARIPGRAVTAVLASGTGSLGGTTTVPTDAQGRAVFTTLAITGSIGTYTIGFESPGLPNATSGPIALSAGAPTQVVFITPPSATATNGSRLAVQPVVALRDAGGNPVLSAGVLVTASLGSGPGSLVGLVTSQTTADGRATFINLELRGLPGSYVLRFNVGTLPALESDPITLAVGPATRLLFDAPPPATASNGAPFATSTIVRLADVAGNLVGTDNVAISAEVASGPGATLGGTTTRLTAGGRATFNNLSLTGSTGTYTLEFTSGSLASATSSNIQLQGGPPTKLAFETPPPGTALSGVAFSPAPVVQLLDVSNNAVSQPGVTVTVSRVSGDGAVVISGGSVLTNASGRATFSGLTLTGPAGDYTLAFLSTGLTGVTSSNIALTPLTPTTIEANSTTSQSATVGTAVGAPPSVRVTSAGGHPVAGVDVTFAVTSGGGTTSPASPATVSTNASGIATLSNWTVGVIPGGNTVTATAAGLAGSPVTFTATGTVLLPTTIEANSTTSQSATTGTVVGAAPSVRVTGAGGLPVGGVAVTFTVTSGGGTISPASPATVSTNASGIATLASWTVGATAGSNTVTATAAGLAGSPVVFTATGTAPSATVIAANSATGQSAIVGTTVAEAPSVRVTGPVGVPVSGVAVTFVVTSGGGTISPSSPATVSTNASGIATLSNWTVGALPGSNTVTATAAGLAGSPVTFTATGTVLLPTTIEANSTTSQSATAGTTVGAPPSVRVTGVGGLPVGGVAVTFTVTSGGGTISPASPATVSTNASGVATLASWTLGATPGANTVSAAAAGLTGSPVVFGAMGEAAAATTITRVSVEDQTAPVGTAVGVAPTVRVTGAGGAFIAGVAVTFAVTSGGGSIIGPTTVTTNSGGVAAVGGWILGTSAGSNTLSASVTGLAGSPVSFSATGTAAAPTRLVITTQPGGAVPGVPFTSQPVVEIRDDFGNLSPSSAVVSAVISMGSGSLSGTSSVNAVGGIATFSGLTISGTGNHRLTFTSPGLTSAVSNLIMVRVDD